MTRGHSLSIAFAVIFLASSCNETNMRNENDSASTANDKQEVPTAQQNRIPTPRCEPYREQRVSEYDRKLDTVWEDGNSFICATGIFPTRMIETVRQLNLVYSFDPTQRRYFATNFVKYPFIYSDLRGNKVTVASPQMFQRDFEIIFSPTYKNLFEDLEYTDFEANTHTPGAMYANGAIWLTAGKDGMAMLTSFFPDALAQPVDQ